MENHKSELNNFKGHKVKVTYPDVHFHTMKGLLLEINDDHIVLKHDEDDVVHYIKLDKIRGISKNTKDVVPEMKKKIPFTNCSTFPDLLRAYENSWVKLTREGVKTIQGFISKVQNSHIIFIVKDEISIIPLQQIAYLSSKEVMHTTKKEKEECKNHRSSEDKHVHKPKKEDKGDAKEEKQKQPKKKDPSFIIPFKEIPKLIQKENKRNHSEPNSGGRKKVVYRSTSNRKKKRVR
ncbi:hypothetical protein [Oceanobacillus halophilus]|uniref:Spore coat protein B n=1 Tax=Oceanobacillus halophilus TaxID=930130 RepID=A0A495ABM9_9BACI|nr:hypothetical protein [Oceanobacillus halophilus]RKQ37253.1 hypothetical protein D8M06_00110 [Oceanobacillus halophilus]